jgi:hypothetical protein
MSSKTIVAIGCHVKRLPILVHILEAIEDASRINEVVIDAISVEDDNATVAGENVSPLVFQLSIHGYDVIVGPNKTHLFIGWKEKK